MEESKATAVDVVFFPISFGMVAIDCPGCHVSFGGVSVGLTTAESEEPSEDGLPNLMQMGVVAYPCGHVFGSPCLTDKVARILNARDEDSLRLGMFHNLISCEEHGVEFPEQS